jgi:hypothetical protein
MTSAPIVITKTDAARRQLDTAITLWFHDADSVSIHSLGSASLGILHDLGERIGEPAMMYNHLYFRPDTFEEWKKAAKRAQNFFKHADRKNDPIAIHEFRPTSNEYLLADCVDTYSRVTKERTAVMGVFWSYFMLHHPEYFLSIAVEQIPAELRTLQRIKFFQRALPFFQASGAEAVIA